MLEIQNVSKTYTKNEQTVHALDDVSLKVTPGEFVAVRGPSGCGKTTLLLTAGALLAPEAGQVLIDGRDPYGLGADERAGIRARLIGFVFQQFHLVPYLTVRENVLAAALARPSAGAAARAEEMIRHFHLADRADHVPAELSTGERQRTALARATLNSPALLLADEPTGNLDGTNADIVLGYLGEFARNGGAVLLVTHDDHAAGFAQRTVQLAAGRIRAD
jgi:ABC-type lipoprotein export system ATPase subunit